MRINCYPKCSSIVFLFLAVIMFLFSMGPLLIDTDDELIIKILWSSMTFVFSIISFLIILYYRQYCVIEDEHIVLRNSFGVLNRINISESEVYIQELPSLFSPYDTVYKKWICLYPKNSKFRFKNGFNNGKKKKGIMIILTDDNYNLIKSIFK